MGAGVGGGKKEEENKHGVHSAGEQPLANKGTNQRAEHRRYSKDTRPIFALHSTHSGARVLSAAGGQRGGRGTFFCCCFLKKIEVVSGRSGSRRRQQAPRCRWIASDVNFKIELICFAKPPVESVSSCW